MAKSLISYNSTSWKLLIFLRPLDLNCPTYMREKKNAMNRCISMLFIGYRGLIDRDHFVLAQNWQMPLSHKLSNILPHFLN